MTTEEKIDRLTEKVEQGFALIHAELGALNTRLEVMNTKQGYTDKDMEEVKGRVTSLEKRVWSIPSLAAVISVVALLEPLWRQLL